ncbi:MAG: AraC family transcriptional regulator [Bacillota bacterium]|nr:AraC family transcriptional regulator [Bacillota bacterium]
MTNRKFNLRLVQAISYENDHQWNYPFNLYPFHTLYLVEDADGFVKTAEGITALRPGEACLIPAFTLFSCWCESKIKKIYVEFFLDLPSGQHVIFEPGKVQARPLALEQLKILKSLSPAKSLQDNLRFEGELLCVLSQFVTEAQVKPSKEFARLHPLLTEIHLKLGCDLQLGELARNHGFSPSSLSHTFKRAFSCTPKQYVQQLLANVIKHELLHTDKSISQLADEYRFCDAYYLSNFFKRLMGISPRHYRQRSDRFAETGTRILP